MKYQKDFLLKELTTFKVGGKTKYFVEVKNKNELVKAVSFARNKNLSIFVLGGGSDILLSDNDFNGLVIKFRGSDIKITKTDNNSSLIWAQAGARWDDMVAESIRNKLQGIECLSGIPGTVGAAPIQNIGAYGQELKDTFVNLTTYDCRSGKFVKFSKKACEFGYRESVFKQPKNKNRYFITSLTLRLNVNRKPEVKYQSLNNFLKVKGIRKPSLYDIRNAVLELRGRVLEDPKLIGNAGSFFKNPIINIKKLGVLKKTYPNIPSYPFGDQEVKLFAGWLVEKAGWKGKTYKNAKVSEKHALIITNPNGKAKAKEIKALADKISRDVHKKFGVILEPEVQYIHF